MSKKIVDLHTHSFYSDGTMSPSEILNTAIRNNIGILAITDHNILDGTKELIELNKKNNHELICISGVELDAVEDNINFHVLAYNFDVHNKTFNHFVENNRELLEEVNLKLIKKIEKDTSSINLIDYQQFDYDKSKGGWKALHYFISKGLTNNLVEGLSVYSKYKHSYTCVNFPSIKDVCTAIHSANGKAILAHPGKVIKSKTIEEFEYKLRKIIPLGIDGIECYYPSHSKEITEICKKLCIENGLIMTSGSDCHGEFEETVIGEVQTPVNRLNIEILLY